MNKKLSMLVPMILLLSACAADGTATTSGTNANTAQQLGMSALKIAVNTKCVAELNQTTAWRVASQVMTSQQQQAAQDKVCGCVSDKAVQSVTVTDLVGVAFDPSARTTIATKAIQSTVNACVAEALK